MAPKIFHVDQGTETSDHQIVVFDGELADFFARHIVRNNAHQQEGVALAIIRSRDRGMSWSTEIVVDQIDAILVRDPFTGAPIRAGTNPDVAVGPRTGVLYAVWADGRFSGDTFAEIAFMMSLDSGKSWTTPAKVNLTPSAPQLANRQAFLPSVAVGADGSVASATMTSVDPASIYFATVQ